jgi:hypothetical protein
MISVATILKAESTVQVRLSSEPLPEPLKLQHLTDFLQRDAGNDNRDLIMMPYSD